MVSTAIGAGDRQTTAETGAGGDDQRDQAEVSRLTRLGVLYGRVEEKEQLRRHETCSAFTER